MAANDFEGKIGEFYKDSVEAWPEQVRAPAGAPNVLVWLLDDAGFAHLGSYGGLIDTPVLDRLAARGVRYSNGHATAICSPSRAALLTGRNHHAVHMGGHIKVARGFPGYDGRIPDSAASLADVLGMNGYATFAVGKWDQMPTEHATPSGPFHYWPSGQGFDRFYGFLQAEASQFEPQLYADHTPISPPADRESYHLTTDMADQTIRMVTNLKAVTSDRPFFVWWATGAVHSPIHAPRPYIEKYTGRFDIGWDKAREQILERQKALGIVPADAELPPRPDDIPSWDSLSPEEQRLHARQMEAFAAMMEHADQEFGRILAALEKSGELDNTLIIVTSDNGASAEGGPHGSYNEARFSRGLGNSHEFNAPHFNEWGGPDVYGHYSAGWAMAGNAPFKYYKQTVFGGGVRVPMIISWRDGRVQQGAIRSQFHHINDIMPTVLDVVGIDLPTTVDGVEQQPLDGVSMTYSFEPTIEASPKKAQYFEMWGNRAIWADGWKAVVNHSDRPWDMAQPAQPFSADHWELYHVAEDFNELHDLAEQRPDKLAEMKALFDREARRNNVYPLKSAADGWQAAQQRAEAALKAVDGRFVYHMPGVGSIPEDLAPPIHNRSFTITADLNVPAEGANGIIVSQGGLPGGYAFYVVNNQLKFVANYVGESLYTVEAKSPLPSGPVQAVLAFQKTGELQGEATLRIDGAVVATQHIDRLVAWAPINETFDIGLDRGSAVSPDYQVPFRFSGTIDKVVYQVDVDG